MSENTKPDDPRQGFIQGFKDTVDRHRERAFDYESKAIDYGNNALRALTYLNGGALVAIPTAVALFQADIANAKVKLITAALCFVAGLIFVVMSQACGFYTMARRSEAETLFQYEKTAELYLEHYNLPEDLEHQQRIIRDDSRANAVRRVNKSNYWRFGALVLFWLSLVSFIGGCYFGARAVLG